MAFLLDQGWIVPSGSSASHASVLFARKAAEAAELGASVPQCHHAAVSGPSVEPLPHVDQLVGEARSARFFTKTRLCRGLCRSGSARSTSTTGRFASPAATISESAPSLRADAQLLVVHAPPLRPPSLTFDASGRASAAGPALQCWGVTTDPNRPPSHLSTALLR